MPQSVPVEEILAMADRAGIGPAFRRLFGAATSHGLAARGFQNSIMYTPPQNRSRMLITTWIDWSGRGPGMWTYPEGFEQFLGISSSEAERLLHPRGWQPWASVDVDAYVEGLDELFQAASPTPPPLRLRVGDRVELRQDVERYPFATVPAGAIGTVTASEPELLCVRLDEVIEGLEDWGNEVRWTDGSFREQVRRINAPARLGETTVTRDAFFEEVVDALVELRPNIRRPKVGVNPWIRTPKAPFGWYGVRLGGRGLWAEVVINTGDSDRNGVILDSLLAQQASIEETVGSKVTGERLPVLTKLIVYGEAPDFSNEEAAAETARWAARTLSNLMELDSELRALAGQDAG
jgi:hypothetical protein